MRTWHVLAAFALLICAGSADAATRRYYIQAEKEIWSFAAETEAGLYINNCTGRNYSDGSELYMQIGAGSRYYHARYVQYTDETFTTKYERPADEVHLGILGPVLRTVAGDTLEILFSNTLDFEVTLTPNGVLLSENDTQPVAANETMSYMWNITEDMSPGANETSSKIWVYTSAVDPFIHQNMGLLGGLIVTRANAATADGRPNDTDIEIIALFHVFDENQNLYFNDSLLYWNLTDPLVQTNLSQASWEEANLKHAINGKMYCWNEGMVIPAGKRARWHVVDVGGEPDIHNFHWHGMVLNFSGTTLDQFSAFAGSTYDADMITDNPGTWFFHCHINDHIHAGMLGFYTLEGQPINRTDQGDVVEYYIAADEVEWDYAPHLADMCSGSPTDLSDDAALQLTPSNFSLVVGHKTTKALFNEYTDATFTRRKPKDASLGFLGPTIRAKVGDTIKVHYKNNARFTTGLHPHGVLYAKNSEGSPYNDGTSPADKGDDYVHTGQTWTYTWYVDERAAPGPLDGSSVVWMYHSHSHEIQDSYAGLMGAIIIVRRDMATPDNKPSDVSREYVVMFSITNEASSFMLRTNLAKYFPGLPRLQYSTLVDTVPDFTTHANMHALNGYMYCNGPSFNATVGERVRFYVLSLGTEADLHTPDSSLQWLQQGRRRGALINIPGDMQTADVIPTYPGDFTVQCRTSEHVEGGMISIFHVEESNADILATFNGTERISYIAATPVIWDYIPVGLNNCTGEEFDDETAANWGDGTMGHIFMKAAYRGFTDDTFTQTMEQQNPSDGLAGPTLRGEVGDIITVVFMNNLSFPVNLHLSGGFKPLHNETLNDAPVDPGATVTYMWLITPSNGPGQRDLGTIAYTYGSNVEAVGDLNAGLFGVVSIAREDGLEDNGLPVGVDYEIPLFFNTIDESASSLFEANQAFTNFTVPDELTDYDVFTAWQPTASWYTINGFSWCNQPNVMLNASSIVRWILVGLGGELSLNTPVFANEVLVVGGLTSFTTGGETVQTTLLAPAVTRIADMRARAPGVWEYSSNLQEHYEGGMIGLFEIAEGEVQSS